MKTIYNVVTFLAAVVVLGAAGCYTYTHWDVITGKKTHLQHKLDHLKKDLHLSNKVTETKKCEHCGENCGCGEGCTCDKTKAARTKDCGCNPCKCCPACMDTKQKCTCNPCKCCPHCPGWKLPSNEQSSIEWNNYRCDRTGCYWCSYDPYIPLIQPVPVPTVSWSYDPIIEYYTHKAELMQKYPSVKWNQ